MAERKTPLSIQLYTEQHWKMIGQIRKCGRRRTRRWASRSVWIRSRRHLNPQGKTLLRRTAPGNFGSTNGSNKPSAGCQWINGMPVLLPLTRKLCKVVSATADLTSPLHRYYSVRAGLSTIDEDDKYTVMPFFLIPEITSICAYDATT